MPLGESVVCPHCKTQSGRVIRNSRGRVIVASGEPGGCACENFWKRLPALLMLGAECARITAYGDARQAAERADVVAFLLDEDRPEESIGSDVAAIERGEHVGAAKKAEGSDA